jgi:D-alanyl-D-alanine carboxypeptidase
MFDRDLPGRLAAKNIIAAMIAVLAGAGLTTPAQARHHHHGHHAHGAPRAHAAHARHSHGVAAAPGGATAAIVVDGATGRMIYGMNELAPRHPASVTKVMTLYLLFEQLEKGRLSLDDEIPISAHAAVQKPTKLGLRPGQTIRVEDAIKAIVTKSANDIAVAVAEALGGTESEFAELMTRKAASLGMTHTLYRNASGLPNDEQITTASDLAILGRAIQERFPRYYRYFSIHEFAYRGERIHNHNHLMERVEGMDGIKTGYTAASGFNLLSSVKRDGHFIVSVVMGGRTARSRDNYMEALIDKYIDESGSAQGAARVAEQEEPRAQEPERQAGAEANPAPPAKKFPPAPGESPSAEENLRLSVAAYSPDPLPRPAYVSASPQTSQENEDSRMPTGSIPRPGGREDGSTTAQTRDAASTLTPTGHWITGPSGREALRAATRFQPATAAKMEARLEPREAKQEAQQSKAQQPKPEAQQPKPEAQQPKPEAQQPKPEPRAMASKSDDEGLSAQPKQALPTKPPAPGWMIQIGATDDAEKAEALLAKAKAQRAGLLATAKPYTEIVRKGRETLYRARFAGLEESKAEAACRALKTSGFNCFTTKN